MLESYPILTLLPPVIAIVLVIITKKVLLSLGAGVLAAALLIADLNPLNTLQLVWESFAAIFWIDGGVNTWYVYILTFTMLLGVIAAFIMMAGGTTAFADWAVQRIRSRRGAQFLPAIMGVVIFIDDYFNALAVGQVAKPVTDRHRVSRAKLAYVIDSTSAPVVVLAPFSSWGAYIMGILAPVVAASTLSVSSVQAFLGAAAANYYAIAAVLTVWLVVVLRIDLPPMRTEEKRAIDDGRTYDEAGEIPGELSEDLPVHEPGAMRALIVPFVLLVVGVFAGIIWTGYAAAGTWNLIDILAATDSSAALMVGGTLGIVSAIYYYLRYTAGNPTFSAREFGRGWSEGAKSMWPAVSILILAWMLTGLIEQLGTGAYLGGLVEDANIAPSWLIPVTFILAAAMAFATGTSWGSFALLIPLVGGIMNTVGEPDLLLPTLGAVLAGAVLGDHTSPISDTTILSSTGAGCNVITHVLTQAPYAAGAAIAALAGYVALALGASTGMGLVVVLAALAVLVLVARTVSHPLKDPDESSDASTGTASEA